MHISLNFKGIALMLLLALSCRVHAEGDRQVSVQFRTYSVSGAITGLSCLTSKGAIAVDVPSHSRSKVMTYQGSRTMVFYRNGEQTDGQQIVPLAKVELEEGIRAPLFIFIKSRSREDGLETYRVKVIDDHPESFANGSMKFVNLTQGTLYLIVGQDQEVKKSMKPGGHINHQLPEGFKGNLPVKMALKHAKGMVPVMNSRVFPSRSTRDLYFIWPVLTNTKGNM